MSIQNATFVTCDMCGKEICIRHEFMESWSAKLPDGWRIEGINSFRHHGEREFTSCPDCTKILDEAQKKYDNAVAEAEKEFRAALNCQSVLAEAPEIACAQILRKG